MKTENASALVAALKLAFHDEQALAPEALRGFLQEGRGWERVNPELPAGPHTWKELLEAVTSALFRFRLVDDMLFDRLIERAPAARSVLEDTRSELLHPERIPSKWELIGPVGGAVERIEVDPHDHRRLLCCVHVRIGKESRIRLFRSMDRGASWTEQEIADARNLPMRWISFDPHRAGNVFMGTDAGLWKSEDHGDTWTQDPACAPDVPVWQVRVHPFHEDALFIAVGRERIRGSTTAASATSTAATPIPAPGQEIVVRWEVGRRPGWFQFFDKGAGLWTSINLVSPQTAASFSPRDWRRVWVATDSGLVRSDDACRTFKAMGSVGNRRISDFAVDLVNSDRIAVGTWDGIYCSSDGGLTFDRSSDASSVEQFVVSSEAWYAAAWDGPLCSRDGGATWQPIGNGFPDQRCTSLARALDGTLYAGAAGAGVYRLDVGSDAWIPRSAGLMALPVRRPTRVSSTNIAVVSELGLNTTRDGGRAWDYIRCRGISIAGADPDLIQMAVGDGRDGQGLVWLTRDAGKSWRKAQTNKLGNVFWTQIHDGGVWARTDQGWLGRLTEDLSWEDDGPLSDDPTSARLADVVVLDDGTWVAIAVDGTLYCRGNAAERWQLIPKSPAELSWKPFTWRLANTRAGWFSWRYEGGFCATPELGKAWNEIDLPESLKAIGGVCGDPRGTATVWVAAQDGSLFCVTSEQGSWHWEQYAEPWPQGQCAFLDSLLSPPSLLGSGSGGLYAFSIRA
jgi:hypothetical protein